MVQRRIPLWVKLIYTGFVGVVVLLLGDLHAVELPVLLRYRPARHGGRHLDGEPAVDRHAGGRDRAAPDGLGGGVPGELLFGVRLTNIAHYMFDERIPLFVRGLSSFHGWLPFVLLWLLTRVRYDRRALRAQLAVAAAVLLVSFYFAPAPPPLAAHPSWAVNINYVYGFDDTRAQTKMAPELWFAMMAGIAAAFCVTSHLIFVRLFRTSARRP